MMRNTLKIFFFTIVCYIIIFLSFTNSVPASSITVQMSVDGTDISLDEEVTLKVLISGVRNSEEPEITNLDDFSAQSQGTSTSMSIINGQMKREITYSYSLMPEKEGNFTIGPAIVRVNNQDYVSNTITLQVKKSATVTPSQDEYIYITAHVDNLAPYVNEQIVYTFRLFSRIKFVNAHADIPEFEGFWQEEMGKQREYQKVINGQRWDVTELKYALFPLKSGTMTIQGAKLTCDILVKSKRRSRSRDPFFDDSFFDDFFNYSTKAKRRVLRSRDINLSVRPLPDKGKPDNFTNLVGHFTMKAALSKNEVKIGDTATLTVTIEGNGNVRNALLPETDYESLKIKKYDDNPSFKLSVRGDRVIGTKTFSQALVPLSDGTINLSYLKIPYFDPSDRTYHIAETSGLTLHAITGDDKDEPLHLTTPLKGDSKQEVKVLGRDLMPIYMKLDALDNQKFWDKALPLYLTFAFFPALVFLITFIYKKRQEKFRADSGILRRRKALKRSRAHMKELNHLEGHDFYDRASQILRTYVGDKLNIDGNVLTSDELRQKLEPINLSSDIKERVYRFVKDLEAGLYSGQNLDNEKKNTQSMQLAQLIETFDKEITD